MPNIHEIRTIHSGFVGGPGYTQFYFDATGDAQAQSDAVRTFWETVGASFCGPWRYSIQADVKTLNDSTGGLISVTGTTPLTQSVFGFAGPYTGGAGSCISWSTGAVHSGRPLRGRTFLVPLTGAAYDSDGTLTSGTLSSHRAAAATLAARSDFGIWGRPVAHLNGLWSDVTASNVRDQVAILRSRRT